MVRRGWRRDVAGAGGLSGQGRADVRDKRPSVRMRTSGRPRRGLEQAGIQRGRGRAAGRRLQDDAGGERKRIGGALDSPSNQS
jgi:hypothetical protein